MKVVVRTDEYTIYQKRSDRYAVRSSSREWINGEDKVRVLLEHKLIEAVQPGAARPEQAPAAENAAQADATQESAEEVAEEATEEVAEEATEEVAEEAAEEVVEEAAEEAAEESAEEAAEEAPAPEEAAEDTKTDE